jgi:hypothetical protein
MASWKERTADELKREDEQRRKTGEGDTARLQRARKGEREKEGERERERGRGREDVDPSSITTQHPTTDVRPSVHPLVWTTVRHTAMLPQRGWSSVPRRCEREREREREGGREKGKENRYSPDVLHRPLQVLSREVSLIGVVIAPRIQADAENHEISFQTSDLSRKMFNGTRIFLSSLTACRKIAPDSDLTFTKISVS